MMKPDRNKAPEVRPFGFRELPADEVERLENGATLHLLRGGKQAVGQLTILFAGGKHDVANPAVCMAFPALLTEGAGCLSGKEIADRMDFAGAVYGGNPSAHYTGFSATVLSDRLTDILPVLKAMIVEPHFAERDVKTAAQMMSARLQIDRQKVLYRAGEELKLLIFGAGHPQAYSMSEADIEALSPESLKAFHASLTKPEGAHIYLSGGFSEGTIEAVRSFLGELRAPAPAAQGIRQNFDSVPEPAASGTVVLEMDGAVQTAVCAGIPAVSRSSADFLPLRLAVMALGGYFGSRLMSNIREEKGLTYHIDAFLAALHDGAAVNIQAQCKSENVEEVMEEIRKELRLMAENPPQGRELERLKLTAMTTLAEVLDSPISISGYRMLELITGTPRDYFEAQQRAISSLSTEELGRVSEKYLRAEELRVAVAGPGNN